MDFKKVYKPIQIEDLCSDVEYLREAIDTGLNVSWHPSRITYTPNLGFNISWLGHTLSGESVFMLVSQTYHYIMVHVLDDNLAVRVQKVLEELGAWTITPSVNKTPVK